MKSLIVYYDGQSLQTELEDVCIPRPGPREVLVKVEVAGSNVKDYKHPLPQLYNNRLNQGDDCAGTIAAVGSAIRRFRVGDRVAGFHRMETAHGTYAEFSICPENTVFHIPSSMSLEEAATVPLAAYTAAVGLFRNLGLPTPWDRSDPHIPLAGRIPLVINGGSTAVGAFAIKLAKLCPGIGPIIATAGASINYVRALGPDKVVDYRSDDLSNALKTALDGAKLCHVFDTANSLHSIQFLTGIMERGSRYTCTSALYPDAALNIDDSMVESLKRIEAWYENTFVGDVHGQPFRMGETVYEVTSGGILFGAVVSRWFETALEDGHLSGHPYRVVTGGLLGVKGALNELKNIDFSGNSKFVTRIADTLVAY